MRPELYCKICGEDFESVDDVIKHLVEVHGISKYNVDLCDLIGIYAGFEDILEELLEEKEYILFSCDGLRVVSVCRSGVVIEVYGGFFDMEKFANDGVVSFELTGGRVRMLLPWAFIDKL